MRSERDFDEWVRQRLSSWPTETIRDFELWLREHGSVEFVPAVRKASRRGTRASRVALRVLPSARSG